MDWVPPEFLKNSVDNYFFVNMWCDWSLIGFIETKRSQILADLQKVAVHHSYKKDLQSILEAEPPDDVSFAIMKQLTQKITESEEVKLFWKTITAEKKYREQLTNIRASASFESVSLCVELLMEYSSFKPEWFICFIIVWSTPLTTLSDVLKIRGKRFVEEIDDVARRDVKRVELGNDNEDIKLFSTPHKPILTPHKFSMISLKVIPGFKSLKNILKIRYPEIVNEIETYEEEQKRLTSLGTTLKVWLGKILSSTTPEELYKCLMEQLQGENITDRDKKLHEIFELTVSTPFKLVEYVFGTITTYWIEKEIMSTKATEFVDNPIGEPVSKKADALATDLTHNIDVMNMESSGGPFQQDRKHTLEDSEKISNTGVNILLTSLRKYLGASIETAKKLKTFNIQIVEDRIMLMEVSLYKPRICKEIEVRSAVFPFALSSIGEYMRIFELNDELLKRQEVIRELSKETNGVKEI
ncbi:14986_t:CDS:2, partial [Acaulospora morrowiae]